MGGEGGWGEGYQVRKIPVWSKPTHKRTEYGGTFLDIDIIHGKNQIDTTDFTKEGQYEECGEEERKSRTKYSNK